jgi:hypothetical protein
MRMMMLIIMRSLRKNFEAVLGRHSIDSLQKTAILGTSDIIWKELQFESLKPERWGSLLVQVKYQEEMPVTRDINIV